MEGILCWAEHSLGAECRTLSCAEVNTPSLEVHSLLQMAYSWDGEREGGGSLYWVAYRLSYAQSAGDEDYYGEANILCSADCMMSYGHEENHGEADSLCLVVCTMTYGKNHVGYCYADQKGAGSLGLEVYMLSYGQYEDHEGHNEDHEEEGILYSGACRLSCVPHEDHEGYNVDFEEVDILCSGVCRLSFGLHADHEVNNGDHEVEGILCSEVCK